MGQKDLAEKQFLSFEDVFADIFNSIVLKQELIDPKKLPVPKEYLPHQRILVVDVAGLDKEEIARMKSDFKYVAEMMAHKRENKDYQPSKVELRHWSEFLRLMDQLDRDYLKKFIEEMNKSNQREGAKMIGYLDEIEAKGEAKGRAEGKILGAVRVMIRYRIKPDEIRKNIHEDYPDFDQSKLDDIIEQQKKELGIS